MMRLKTTLVTALATAFLLLTIFEILGVYLVHRHGMFIRLVPVDDLTSVQPSFESMNVPEISHGFHNNDPVVLLRAVMDMVPKSEPFNSANISEIYAHVQSDGGLICTGMATLYSNALEINDLKTRHIIITRNLYGLYDAHTTVEVLLDGKWLIYDPTFNVSFRKNDQLIGAQDIADALYDGTYDQIEPVFYGDVRYPVRLDNYYMHWLSLYNNVFVWERSSQHILAKVPPFRYWFGPKLYFEAKDINRQYHYEFSNRLYFTLVVVLPGAIVAAGGGLLAAVARTARKK